MRLEQMGLSPLDHAIQKGHAFLAMWLGRRTLSTKRHDGLARLRTISRSEHPFSIQSAMVSEPRVPILAEGVATEALLSKDARVPAAVDIPVVVAIVIGRFTYATVSNERQVRRAMDPRPRFGDPRRGRSREKNRVPPPAT